MSIDDEYDVERITLRDGDIKDFKNPVQIIYDRSISQGKLINICWNGGFLNFEVSRPVKSLLSLPLKNPLFG